LLFRYSSELDQCSVVSRPPTMAEQTLVRWCGLYTICSRIWIAQKTYSCADLSKCSRRLL